MDKLAVLGVLKAKMIWHQRRQTLLAHNIAHGERPGFVPRDLKPFSVRAAVSSSPSAPTATPTDSSPHPRHLPLGSGLPATIREIHAPDSDVSHSGNAVLLEEQMAAMSDNRADHKAASVLYARALGLLGAALGNR